MKKYLARLAVLLVATLTVITAFVPTARAAVASYTLSPTNYVVSEALKIRVNFPGSYPKLSLWRKTGDVWAKVSGQTAKASNSYGIYTFTYRVMEEQTVQVRNDSTRSTDATPEIQLTPTPTGATLDPITSNSSGTSGSAVARFTPVRSGQATALQVLKIVTTMTGETPTATWQTVKTGTQGSTGKTTFALSNPLEVQHRYRAITTPSGGSVPTESNEVTFKANRTSKQSGIPSVYLDANEGSSINTRDRYFEGTFEVVNDPSVADADACVVKNNKDAAVTGPLKAAAKGRGNYSWSFAKKSFTVKLDKKHDLCGMGASKKWALVANHYDKSLLRNSVAGYIGSQLDHLAWTPEQRPVDLYVNGSYRGSYILIERVAPDASLSAPRVPYSAADDNTELKGEDTGYILEWDFRKGADHNITAGDRGYVGIKDPENDYDDRTGADTGLGITQTQIDYIDGYVDAADAALFTGGAWRDYIDEDSAVDYYIGMELLKPVDGNMWASVYMVKRPGGKLEFGPLWDFDLAAGSANRAGGTVHPTGWYLRDATSTSAKQSAETWFNRLSADPEFRLKVRARLADIQDELRTSDDYLTRQSALIGASAAANFTKWSVTERLSSSQVVKGSWPAEVSYLRGWLSARITWMVETY